MNRPPDHWNSVYSRYTDLPWDTTELPTEIHDLIRTLPRGARVLDIGCGRGQHSRRMAALGVEVLGIDYSEVAIEQARKMSVSAGSALEFRCAHVCEFETDRPFDLIVDYSVFHHISPNERPEYAARIVEALSREGLFLLVCYSDRDPLCGGRPLRKGLMGNLIAHPTRREICDLFDSTLRLVSEKETVLGEQSRHEAHQFVFKK